MADIPVIFDDDLLQRRLARARRGDARPDFLLRRVEEDISERLSIVRRKFESAAVYGAFDSGLAGVIRRATGASEVIEIAGGAGYVPVASQSLDLFVSSLWLHLENDVPGVLAQAQRALKPDGLFLAALLGGETLNELRTAWLAAEEELTGGASPRVAPFADVRQLGALLQRAGFALPVADSDVVTVGYSSALALMQELRAMGMSNMLVGRRRVPVTRGLLFRASEIYAERFADGGGRIPATFEIVTLTGWAPHESQQKPLQPGSARQRLADALGISEVKVKRDED